jgi:hypothetical protein
MTIYVRIEGTLERAMGIEPTSEAWEASILPLNYARPESERHDFTTEGKWHDLCRTASDARACSRRQKSRTGPNKGVVADSRSIATAIAICHSCTHESGKLETSNARGASSIWECRLKASRRPIRSRRGRVSAPLPCKVAGFSKIPREKSNPRAVVP